MKNRQSSQWRSVLPLEPMGKIPAKPIAPLVNGNARKARGRDRTRGPCTIAQAPVVLLVAIALASCGRSTPKFPGTYDIVAYSGPGAPAPTGVPRQLQGMTLGLGENGSATLHIPGRKNDGEYTVSAADNTALITDGGSQTLRANF